MTTQNKFIRWIILFFFWFWLIFSEACLFKSREIEITAISPTEVLGDLPVFTLTVFGHHFNNGCRIIFNGQTLETVFVSESELNCQVELEPMTITYSVEHEARIPVSITDEKQNNVEFEKYLSIKENPVFDPEARLADPAVPADYYYLPELVVGNTGILYLAWCQNDDIYFSRSTDQGKSWSAYTTFPQQSAKSGNYDPAMAADGTGNLYIIWTQSANRLYPNSAQSAIFFAKVAEMELKWSVPRILAESESCSKTPRIMFSNQNQVVVVLGAKKSNLYRLTLLTSDDFGESWLQFTISENIFNNFDPLPILLSGDNSSIYYFTYNDYYNTRYGYAVYFRTSEDLGQSWGNENPLLSIGGETKGIRPDEKGNLFCIGSDMYLPYMSRTVFIRSTDRGKSWEKTILSEKYSRSDLISDPATGIGLVYGNNFRRVSENGGQLYREQKFTEKAVHDCHLVGDAAGNIFFLWQEDQSPYGIYFSHGRLQK